MAKPWHVPGWLLLLLHLLSLATGVCYLEDAAATCSVCWHMTTKGVKTVQECLEGGISVQWVVPLPEVLYADVEYHVKYTVAINTTIYPLILRLHKGSPVHLPHTNIHSCFQTGTACTPFVADSPGLSTHTAEMWGNMSMVGDLLTQTYETRVRLPAERYTILVHSRFYIPTPEGGETKVDTATGIRRVVLPLQPPTSQAAYIGAGAAGFMMLTVAVSVVWGSKSGRLDFDACILAVTRDEVALLADCLFGLGDMVAYSLTIPQEILVDPALQDIVPVAFLFLATGWGSFLFTAWCDVKQLELLAHRTLFQSSYLDVNIKEVQADANVDVQGTGSSHASSLVGKKLVFEYQRARKDHRMMYAGIVSLMFSDIPLAIISGYSLVLGQSVQFIEVVVICISSVMTGIKVHGLTGFRTVQQNYQKHAQALQNHLDSCREVTAYVTHRQTEQRTSQTMLSYVEENVHGDYSIPSQQPTQMAETAETLCASPDLEHAMPALTKSQPMAPSKFRELLATNQV